ncbi:MAG: glucosamine-6-phosphate deaminase [Pseudomonas sp.]|jgi:glucosamine-6-phosphate deaminase|nr:glucosamine-6-phosphate deaminase [Pseudomonas sp.]MDD2222456.1 glucosamine-6-phosphate deaminase [Pseudomonas sp.]MDY0414580.1 glucosamine-6-phosphate deaminase [Pseudomonas sp.]NLO54951.1 glucosamine-6-phosphate deaminase [Gammaproteobacteria bacterium]
MYKIFDTVDEVSLYTAQRLLEKIKAAPSAVMGLATGSTMEPVYAQLLGALQQSPVDLSQLTTFNLDEYIGLSAEHPQSYNYYMCQHLFNQLNIPKHNIHLPDGLASDIEAACLAYSNAIQTMGGMDLQLLGIGSNGHIGFNEPQTCFNSRTHVVELSEQTRIDNGRFFVEQSEVPTLAITMGIKDILEAKEIILVATGRNKTDIMAQLFSSEIDERLPASALKQHSNLTIVLDREAAALLPEQAFKNAV